MAKLQDENMTATPITTARDFPRNVSVVIPVYNSEASLEELVDSLCRVFQGRSLVHEILLVNDHSRDSSWRVIQTLVKRYPSVKGVNLMRNYGQHNAILCGVRQAVNEAIVTLDDDLQHHPQDIPKLLDKLSEGYDVVYGTPEKGPHGFFRNLASRIAKIILQEAMGAEVARQVGAFRAFRTSVRESFKDYRGPFVCLDVLLTWGAGRFTALPLTFHPRKRGRSNYNLRRLITHTLNMTTGFSTLPLQLASLTGFGFSLFGMGVLVWVVGRFLIHGVAVPGFIFLASTIAIFSGAQLFALGVIGEYLARVHFRVMGKPAYIIRETIPS